MKESARILAQKELTERIEAIGSALKLGRPWMTLNLLAKKGER